MNKDSRNIELEKKMDRYVKGSLTEDEAKKMWVALLKQPEYLPLLEANMDLARFYEQSTAKKSNYNHYWKWVAAAAAVILVVVGINLLDDPSLESYTIDEIELSKNLATATVLRSNEPNGDTAAAYLLNRGFINAISGNSEEAMNAYKEVIDQYPGTSFAAKAHLNTGILKYNFGEFRESVASFEKALSIINSDAFLREQPYWYMGNALIHTENLQQARAALNQAYRLNGVHKAEALSLLKKLDAEIN